MIEPGASSVRARRRGAAARLAGGGTLLVVAGVAVSLFWFAGWLSGAGAPTRRVESIAVTPIDRKMTVRFATEARAGLPLVITPAVRSADVQVGQIVSIDYVAENRGAEPLTATAVVALAPFEAEPYFSRLQCFCFTEQTFSPGERRTLTVVFYIDPQIEEQGSLQATRNISLDYTFYPALKTSRPLAAGVASAVTGRL